MTRESGGGGSKKSTRTSPADVRRKAPATRQILESGIAEQQRIKNSAAVQAAGRAAVSNQMRAAENAAAHKRAVAAASKAQRAHNVKDK